MVIVNLNKYQILLKTVELGSITRAAEALGYTQSAVSRVIADLEREWDMELLTRSRTGVVLSSSGAALLPYVQAVCNAGRELEEQVAELHGVPEGAYNIRANGKAAARNTTASIDIVSKTDKDGIDIIIKPGTKNQSVHIPVVLSESGLTEMVYNDFFIGDDCDVTIVAGCGIHNCGVQNSEHSGIHSFHVGKRARVRYVERHYGEGDGMGENIMNPTTVVEMDEDSYLEMETTQIKGVDSTVRTTKATLGSRATLIIKEKVMTHGKQLAKSDFTVDLNGEDCHTIVISRSVARDQSHQVFLARINGNARCYGHSECDAIIMDQGVVAAIPEVTANCVDASLVHEAAIGKIAGEQLIKLMTLGLTEKEAEEQIVKGFLK